MLNKKFFCIQVLPISEIEINKIKEIDGFVKILKFNLYFEIYCSKNLVSELNLLFPCLLVKEVADIPKDNKKFFVPVPLNLNVKLLAQTLPNDYIVKNNQIEFYAPILLEFITIKVKEIYALFKKENKEILLKRLQNKIIWGKSADKLLQEFNELFPAKTHLGETFFLSLCSRGVERLNYNFFDLICENVLNVKTNFNIIFTLKWKELEYEYDIIFWLLSQRLFFLDNNFAFSASSDPFKTKQIAKILLKLSFNKEIAFSFEKNLIPIINDRLKHQLNSILSQELNIKFNPMYINYLFSKTKLSKYTEIYNSLTDKEYQIIKRLTGLMINNSFADSYGIEVKEEDFEKIIEIEDVLTLLNHVDYLLNSYVVIEFNFFYRMKMLNKACEKINYCLGLNFFC